MVNSGWKISTIIVPSELRCRNVSFFESTTFGYGSIELLFLFKSGRSFASIALRSGVLSERSRHGILVIGLMLDFLDFFFGYVFFGEITETTMWVFRSEFIFPWFVRFVIVFVEISLKLVLTYTIYQENVH